MYRPPQPSIISSPYYSPRPRNNQWSPRGPYPRTGFQWRPNSHFRPSRTESSSDNNEEHWCETCDRSFPSVDQLNRHKQQHQKCNIDGCQFIAHPKVITKHIQMQHSSGLYKKIAKLNNPEEINKWIEERKKKYPTRTNIEKKAEERKERIERGEKMALKRDKNKRDNLDNSKSTDETNCRKRKFSSYNINHSHRNIRSNQRQNQHYKNQQPAKKLPRKVPKIPCVVMKNKLKPFAGIVSIIVNEDSDNVLNTSDSSKNLIEDDFYETESAEPEHHVNTPVEKPILCGALTTLMCDYGSSDEETDEKENVSNAKKSSLTVNLNIKTNSKSDDNINKAKAVKIIDKQNKTEIITPTQVDNKEQSDNDSGPEEVKSIKDCIVEPLHEETPKNNSPILPAKRKLVPKNYHQQNNKYKHKIPSTLLQKLLYKEIRQERNIVLQCIRYIKKMNYFDKSQQ